jgi:hypothetical protein
MQLNTSSVGALKLMIKSLQGFPGVYTTFMCSQLASAYCFFRLERRQILAAYRPTGARILPATSTPPSSLGYNLSIVNDFCERISTMMTL